MVEGYERVYSTIFDLEAKKRSSEITLTSPPEEPKKFSSGPPLS
jgi:hypothetical protein